MIVAPVLINYGMFDLSENFSQFVIYRFNLRKYTTYI